DRPTADSIAPARKRARPPARPRQRPRTPTIEPSPWPWAPCPNIPSLAPGMLRHPPMGIVAEIAATLGLRTPKDASTRAGEPALQARETLRLARLHPYKAADRSGAWQCRRTRAGTFGSIAAAPLPT